MRKILFPALLSLLLPFAAEARVYWPGAGKGGTPEWAEKTGFQLLMTEPVVFNGKKMDMEIGRIGRPLREVLASFRALYPELRHAAGGDFVLLRVKRDEKSADMFLLVANSDGTCSVFHLLRPVPAPKIDKWPEELPLPPGATGKEYLLLPKRNAAYGELKMPGGDRESRMFVLADHLKGMGFSPLTNDLVSGGGIFFDEKHREVIWANFSADSDAGFVYRRKLGAVKPSK